MEDLTVAAVVCRSPLGDVAGNLAALERWTNCAAERGARLICFPEMNLSGYGYNAAIAALAETVPGPLTERLQALAERKRVTLLAGLAEKDTAGRLYASHVVVSPRTVPQVYRKLYLAPPEQDFFTPGDEVSLFTIRGFTFGIQLCYDAHFPELTARMADRGADAVFLPHASPRGSATDKHASWMRHMPARAYDNSIYILAVNQCGDNGNGLSFPGNALALDPSGGIMATHLTGEEGMLLVKMEKRRLERVRGHRMRYFRPNRRPELYREGQGNKKIRK
jgi:predicted amidohydrolase